MLPNRDLVPGVGLDLRKLELRVVRVHRHELLPARRPEDLRPRRPAARRPRRKSLHVVLQVSPLLNIARRRSTILLHLDKSRRKKIASRNRVPKVGIVSIPDAAAKGCLDDLHELVDAALAGEERLAQHLPSGVLQRNFSSPISCLRSSIFSLQS